MGRGIAQPQNIIFWGAGATTALGIRTTAEQEQFLHRVTAASDSGEPLQERVAKALGPKVAEPWHTALFDLITILGDGEEAYDSINDVNGEQLEAMRRNWLCGASDEELRRRIVDLRLIYDWPALKSVLSICPGSATDKFRLNDLFNLLDMHIPTGLGVRTPARQGISDPKKQPGEQFFDARRLIGAKNALLMILIASFYIDYQVCIASKQEVLQQYYGFAKALGRRMQRQSLELSTQHELDEPAFYQGDVGFVSLNYDPIALWVQFLANRELNKDPHAPGVGSSPVPLHLFHDFGHLIPARRIGRADDDWPWYPLNEGATQPRTGVRTWDNRP